MVSPTHRFRNVLWLGLASLAFLWFVLPLALEGWRRVDFMSAADAAAPILDLSQQRDTNARLMESTARREASALAELSREARDRQSVALLPSGVTIRLLSSTTLITPLSLLLELPDSAPSRALAIRDSLNLRGLPAGRYQLRDEESAWLSSPVKFELSGALVDGTEDSLEIEFPIEALGPWRGRVIDASSGNPLPRVLVRWSVRGELVGMPYQADLGQRKVELQEGRFAVGCGGYLARSSQLTIEADGYGVFVTPWIDADGHSPIELGEIVMSSNASLKATLSGRVVADENGVPLDGVSVFAVEPDTRLDQLWMHHGALQGAADPAGPSTRSDQDGRFELRLLQVQPVRLAAFLPSRGLLLSDPLECASGVVLRLATRGLLRGCVLTTPEIRAAGRLQGVCIDAGGRMTAVALDEYLCFELGGLSTGRVRIALQAREPQSAGQDALAEVAVVSVEVREGESAQVELRYGVDAPAWMLAGRVHLPNDVTFTTMRAALSVAGDQSPSRFAVVDLDGNFRLDGEGVGRGRLFVGGSSADASRGFIAMGTVDLSGAQPGPIVFDVRQPVLRGSAWRDGLPAASAELIVEAVGAPPAWTQAVAEGLTIRSDAQGGFEIYGLAPGTYAIGRSGGPRLRFEVLAGLTHAIPLRLE